MNIHNINSPPSSSSCSAGICGAGRMICSSRSSAPRSIISSKTISTTTAPYCCNPCINNNNNGTTSNGGGGGGGGGASLSLSHLLHLRLNRSSSRGLPMPTLLFGEHREVTVKAAAFEADNAAAAAAADGLIEDQIGMVANDRTSLIRTVKLSLMFGTWYLFNIYFNIFNKQVLKVYPFPFTITAVQFAIGSLLILFMWAANLHKRPTISPSQLMVIVPLAILHTMGNLFTNMSLLKVAVSFTHTVKAMEPFFSVLLSAFFLGDQPSGLVLGTLIPVVGGVALASFTEASFNWIGFWSAMASNLMNQSRNVISKKLMTNKEEEETSLDNINLFSIITLVSFVLSAILTIFTEGITFTPSYLQAAGLNIREIYVRCLLAGLCFHAYQQAGYMLLSYVSPVSHSVGNCVKRVVVIASSVLFFRTPISPINSLGTGIALAGVFLYSRVKKIKPKSA